jgi:hypothetical protein
MAQFPINKLEKATAVTLGGKKKATSATQRAIGSHPFNLHRVAGEDGVVLNQVFANTGTGNEDDEFAEVFCVGKASFGEETTETFSFPGGNFNIDCIEVNHEVSD